MFGRTLLEELKEASVSNDEAYVSFFNNGEVRTDKNIVTDRMNSFYQDDFIGTIKYLFKDAAEFYARQNPFDNIKMNLEVGLVYNKEDVDEENNIKENAKPIKDVVRCYTGKVTSFLNGEKSNNHEYQFDRQGFINYNEFISKMKKDGISFDGPETFNDFKEAILSGENFDVSLYADLRKEEEKEETKYEAKEEPKKLIKKSFFRRKNK